MHWPWNQKAVVLSLSLEPRVESVVTIVDRDSQRRDALARVFGRLATVQCVFPDRGGVGMRSPDGAALPRLVRPLFVLRHYRDQSCAPDHGDRLCTVYYGGNGGDDPDAPEGEIERVWRPVGAAHGVLSEDEARELIGYFRRPPSERDESTRPQVIRAPMAREVGPALSILCQGYLAVVVAAEGEAASIIGAEERALIGAHIGWERIPPDIRADIGDRWTGRSGEPGVSEAAWWAKPFEDGAAVDWERVEHQLAEELKKDTGQLPDSIRDLLSALGRKGKSLKDPCTVFQAYQALAGALH